MAGSLSRSALPAGQSVQLSDVLPANVPGRQLSQIALPPVEAKVPASQSAHSVVGVGLERPASQAVHRVAPSTTTSQICTSPRVPGELSTTDPGLQPVQTTGIELLYWPASHSKHATPPPTAVNSPASFTVPLPTSQMLHSVVATGLKDPATHASQPVAPVSSWKAPFSVVTLPGKQSEQIRPCSL